MERSGSPVDKNSVTEFASEIVAAYVSRNQVETGHLGGLILSVYRTLDGLGLNGEAEHAIASEPQKPFVPVRKSIMPDYLICLEDGKKLKMLKRYLRSVHHMTPDEYRAKWNLGSDYPMVAPNYAAQRSHFAKQIGLGKGVGRSKGTRRVAV